MDRVPVLRRVSASDIFGTPHTPIHVARYLMDGECLPHDHDYVDVDLVVGGASLHRSTLGEQAIGPGNLFIMRPGPWHGYSQCNALDVYNCGFGLDLLRLELMPILRDPVLHHLLWSGPNSLEGRGIVALQLSPEVCANCCRHLDAIIALRRQDALYTHTAQVAHLLLFLAEFARSMPGEFRTLVSEPVLEVHPAVGEGIHLLEAHYAEAWSLTRLARTLHLDPSYLARLWKQSTGLPPMAYLLRCRAERAAVLLIRGDDAIGEIGTVVGWADPCYFARRFHAHFGMSPTAYRVKFGMSGDTTLPEPAIVATKIESDHAIMQ